MTGVLLSLAPVLGLIVVGYLLKARGVFGAGFWEGAERLTFYVLFPALLLTSISAARVKGMAILPMAAAMAVATLIMAGLVTWARPALARTGLSGPSFAALLQGAIRPNTYIGIAVLAALYGKAGLPLAAVAIVAVIPLVNFIGIVAHLRWARPLPGGEPAPGPAWGDAVVPALKNPIIIACLLGAALNALGLRLPPVLGPMLEILGRAALPMGLMAVGAGLDLAAARAAREPVMIATVLKLVAMPVAVDLACRGFGVTDVTRAAAVIFAALPVSATAYVVSSQLGGDARLMAGIVTATTVAAAATLPVVVILVG
ncbi:MAG TPA: AEC family transporter [Rhodospirillales bacterium]